MEDPGWRHGGLCCDAGAADLCPDVEGSFVPPRDGVALPSVCGTCGDCAGHIEKGATYRYRSRWMNDRFGAGRECSETTDMGATPTSPHRAVNQSGGFDFRLPSAQAQ